jgi:Na+/proline symporter
VSFAELGFAAVSLYLVALALIAAAARRARRDDTPSDHVLAGRSLGFLVLLLTLYATAHSGNLILGFPGAAYRRGFSFLLSAGFTLTIFVAFHSFASRLRPLAAQHGFVTPGDLFRFRYGESGTALRRAVGLLMSVALANFLLAQLLALGHVTQAVTAGAVPHAAGVLVFAVVIAAYEHLGGMRAVAWSDALQGLLLFSGMALLLVWFVQASGGLDGLSARVAAVRPEAVAIPSHETTFNALSIVLLVALGAMSYPHAIQRIFAARSAEALQRAMGWMGILSFFMTATITLIGVAAIPFLEDLGRLEADQVLPRLLDAWAQHSAFSPYFAVLVFVAALAAIMSTADSVLLSLSSVAVRDLGNNTSREERNGVRATRSGKRVALVVMGAATLLALEPRLTLWRLLELKMELLIQCAPALVIASRGWPVAPPAIFWGICIGTLSGLGLVLSGASLVYGIHAGTIGFAINLTVVGALTGAARSRGAEVRARRSA